MKIGMLLPTFRDNADAALDFARRVDDAGLDGVFAYDHLWPMGTPTKPSLAPFSLLGLVATRHERLHVGPLVARMGLVGTNHLVSQFLTLASLAPGRVLAPLGTGDHLSARENEAYGIDFASADERRALLKETCERLNSIMPVWFGAGEKATNDLARSLGATLNLWDRPVDDVRRECHVGPTNWAGPAPREVGVLLDGLKDAGATWAIFSPQSALEPLKEWTMSNELSKFS